MTSATIRLAFLRLIGVLVFTQFLSVATAQQTAELSPEERLSGLTAILDRITDALLQEELSIDELNILSAQAIDAGAHARAIAVARDPVVDDLRVRLEVLTPDTDSPASDASAESSPGSSAPDAQAIPGDVATPEPAAPADPLSQEVAQLQAEVLAAEAVIKRARAIETRAWQQSSQISGIIRQRFNQRIFARARSILDPTFWIEAAGEFPASAASAGRVSSGAFQRATSKGPIALLPLGLLLLAFAFVAFSQLRRWVIRLVARLVGQSEPTAMGKAITAFLVAGSITAIPTISYWTAIHLARAINAVPTSSTSLQEEMGVAILYVSAAFGFIRAILAPGRPDWRIVEIANAPAIYLSGKFLVLVLFVGFGLILDGLAEQAAFTAPVILASASLLSLLFAVTLIVAMRHFSLMLAGQVAATGDAASINQFRFVRLGMTLAVLIGLIILGALIFGYLSFAWFLSKQLVWAALIFAAFMLIANLLDALGSTYFSLDSLARARFAHHAGINPQWMAQLGMVFVGAGKLMVAIVGLLLITEPWGVTSAGFIAKIGAKLTGFEIGGLNISLTGIATVVLLFAAGIVFTRLLQRWLRERYLPLTELDPGLKTSIATATGYLGYIIAVAVAFGAVGVDLSQLALVAGALSVGIGFGLQSIVNNFLSGLILLVERPIKAGDWIIVGAEEGTVKKVNVRATELQTFDRATVVIPNSELISGTVKNWVLGGTMGRISIVIGVAYGSDAEQVREILLGCAADHPLVTSHPEPNVFFMDFGDSALIFRLDAYLSDISRSLRVRSDIRFTILDRLRKARIEIPFPQRDINLRTSGETDELIEKMRGEQNGGAA